MNKKSVVVVVNVVACVSCYNCKNCYKVKQSAQCLYMLWFSFYFGFKISNQCNFYFPLSQIMVIRLRQRELKIKLI